MFARRQARYGALTGVSVLVVLGILIAINYIGARQNKRWDLTTNKQFSLSDQTQERADQARRRRCRSRSSRKKTNFGRFRSG